MKEGGGGGGLSGLNALHTKLTVNPSVVVDVSFLGQEAVTPRWRYKKKYLSCISHVFGHKRV